jgi:UDP-N-acetylglucosamine 1-carboxyvinyltransferase
MAKFYIEGGHTLNGKIRVSGNKNEALPVLAACLLTDDTVILKRVPRIRDIETLLEIFSKMGGEHEWLGEDSLAVNTHKIKDWRPDPALCEKIRASILLIGPLLSRFGKIELPSPGGDVIGARRIDSHFEVVRALGGTLTFSNPIRGEFLQNLGGDVYLDEPSVTATENLLLLAAIGHGTTRLYNAASEPHVTGLCKMLNSMGAKISGIGSNSLTIEGVSALHGTTHEVGPDFMEVGSFLCLGACNPGELTIEGVEMDDLRFILKTLEKIGINPESRGKNLIIQGGLHEPLKTDITGRVGTIYSGPWPAYPTDLMSVAIVAATQARGTIIFHEKMFEGRMFFTDKLLDMGSNIVLCDPHRVVVTGPTDLHPTKMSSPDVRAGMAMLIAALIGKGESVIDNIYQIERGYASVHEKLLSIGARIRRVD